MTEKAYIYAGWKERAELIGCLYTEESRGVEKHAFEFSGKWMDKNRDLVLDPDLSFYTGRQPAPYGKAQFGFLSDASPDRWGRTLMDRWEIIQARKEGRRPRRLTETDYLLGVHDGGRQGGLRLSLSEGGEFLSGADYLEAPPPVRLRQLEQASLELESEKDLYQEKWLRDLVEPGSSLGGARPKASALAPDGGMWIAKFPSKYDLINVGAWEMVVHNLAERCDINVPRAALRRFSEYGDTFLVERFDRLCSGGELKRVHFASAMTMLGEVDGTERDVGYLDIAEAIERYGAAPAEDLRELWRRMVFYIGVSNTDDHLRNHGFLLQNDGWRLSPAYDINPTYDREFLSLYITPDSNYRDPELALEAAELFRYTLPEAKETMSRIYRAISQNWRKTAGSCHIRGSEIELMSAAFSCADQFKGV